jgi:hypothetical protein
VDDKDGMAVNTAALKYVLDMKHNNFKKGVQIRE